MPVASVYMIAGICRYHKLVDFDCHVLKRPAAHVRNALKTTQQIEAVMRHMQKVRQRV